MSRIYGEALGEEALYRGKDMILGPGVNIYRTPLNGRKFEYMGESLWEFIDEDRCVQTRLGREDSEYLARSVPLHERLQHRLDELGFKPYMDAKRPDQVSRNSPNCTVGIIFSGDHRSEEHNV